MRKTFVNIFSLSASRLVSIASSVILAIISARILGPEAYGQYALILVFIGYFSVLVDFGMSDIVVREIAAGRRSPQEVLRPLLFIRSGLFVLSALTLLAITLLWKPSLFDAMLAALLILLGEGMYSVFDPIFRGVQEMRWLSLVEIVFSMIRASLGAGVLISGYGLVVFLGAISVATLLKFVLILILYRMKFPRLDNFSGSVPMREMVRESVSLFTWRLSSIIYMQMNVPMIAYVFGDITAGHYKAAANLVDIPTGFVAILGTVFFPYFTSIKENQAEKYEPYIRDLLLLGSFCFFPLYFLVQGFGKSMVLAVFGLAYDQAGAMMSILFIQVFTSSLLTILGLVLLIDKKQLLAFKISMVNVLMKFVVLLLGVYLLKEITFFCWLLVSADLVSIVICGTAVIRWGVVRVPTITESVPVATMGIILSVLAYTLTSYTNAIVAVTLSLAIFGSLAMLSRTINLKALSERICILVKARA